LPAGASIHLFHARAGTHQEIAMRVMSSSRPAARVRHTGRIVVPVLGSLLSLIVVTGGEAQQRDVLRTDPTTRESIAAEPERRGYFRSPALRGEVVVFTAEGDLWKASVSGGAAVRLTTHAEVESNAAISPDGRAVAFSAAYEGPREVYLMPMDGGPAERQTWEGGNATVAGWTPDGRILYSTSKYATLPGTQLVALKPCVSSARVAARHVCAPARDRLPFAGAALAAFGPDGTIWFTRWPKQGSYTKRYVGGTAENIWRWSPSLRTDGDGADVSRPALTTTSATEAVPVTGDYPGTSTSPMYWNGRLWFASDRARPGSAHSLGEYGVTAWDAGVMNIWSMSANGGDVRQHTFHDDFDVAQPSMHEGRIVYQHGADLRIIDVRGAAAESRRIDITLPSDFDQMRENWVERPMDFVTSAHVSPDGDRVVLTSRGRVFVAPVGAGRRIEVVREQGVRYREARFMPDGRTLMALSDESGEVELWTLPANGIGERAQLTKDATILRWDGVPSPDGRYLAHHDKNQDLWLYDTKAATDRRIGHSERESAWISSAPGFFDMEWSPDGRWLAYNDVTPNFLGHAHGRDHRPLRLVVTGVEPGREVAVVPERPHLPVQCGQPVGPASARSVLRQAHAHLRGRADGGCEVAVPPEGRDGLACIAARRDRRADRTGDERNGANSRTCRAARRHRPRRPRNTVVRSARCEWQLL
jgi:tricorn protease